MRQRRSSPKRNFRHNQKPRRLQGLPEDEPELPLLPSAPITNVPSPAPVSEEISSPTPPARASRSYPASRKIETISDSPASEENLAVPPAPAPDFGVAPPGDATSAGDSGAEATPPPPSATSSESTVPNASVHPHDQQEKELKQRPSRPPRGRNYGPRGRYIRSENRFSRENEPAFKDAQNTNPPLEQNGSESPAPLTPREVSDAPQNLTPAAPVVALPPQPPPEPLPPGPHFEADELQAKSARELKVIARDYNVENVVALKKHELVCEIIKRNAFRNGTTNSGGILELDRDGFGFLRSPRFNYLENPEDVYVSPTQIRRYNLRRGEHVYGPIRTPKEKERYFALGRVDKVDGTVPEEGRVKPNFDLLTPMFPNRRIFLEGVNGDVSMRAMDLICPLGFGQRGLIVAPPRTGKTILLQKIANAIMENNPKAHLIMLLIDERPEEVTDMLRTVKGEVLASTFDESPARHIHVAEMVMERAKRLVENKIDVVILLDSITRLARAYNTQQPSSGKIMSGGVESSALQKPKRFFGAARNIQEGGSLTIIATALVDTGSRMDDVIFEEFKGTGNMEISLDRNLSDQRIFPAFNISRSGTRKEELLYHPDELPRIHALRKVLAEESSIDAMGLLLEKINRTQNNIEFLMQLKLG